MSGPIKGASVKIAGEAVGCIAELNGFINQGGSVGKLVLKEHQEGQRR